MAIARDDLRRNRLGAQAHLAGDVFLDARIDVGEGADRAGNGAGGDLLARGDEAGPISGELGISLGQLEAEGHRLRVDAVRAADGRRHLMLFGPVLQGIEQGIDIGDQDVGRTNELHVQAGIEHVRGCHALVDEARLRPDDLCEMGQEGDHVVFRHGLDGVDAATSNVASLPIAQTFSAASFGTTPISAKAVVAWASISNQIRKRDSGDQIAVIAGRL